MFTLKHKKIKGANSMNNTFEKNERNNELCKISDLMSDALNEIETTKKFKGCNDGIKTGFSNIDTITCGLQRKDLIVIASRPGVGKTTFAINLACNFCNNNYTIAYFTLEMSGIQFVKGAISCISKVPIKNIK